MARDSPAPLFYPFETGILAWPPAQARILYLGASPALTPPAALGHSVAMVQGFRPDFLALQHTDHPVSPLPQGDRYDLALVLAGRHRGENEVRVAEAISRTQPGSLIVIAGGKDDGIASLRKRLENNKDALAERIARRNTPSPIIERNGVIVSAEERLYHPASKPVPLGGYLSKHHGLVLWLHRTLEADAYADRIRKWYGTWPLVEGRFHTAPGMFSYDRVDAGSKLLVGNLPTDLSGRVADFCAGWGYLACEVAAHCPQVKAIDLYEADHASIGAAKRNVASNASALDARFFWHDLVGEPVVERYDAIVMNPPFHQGRSAEPGLGQALIAVAAKALDKGGRLFMVANRQLPYEATLAKHFARLEKRAEEQGFKVFAAVR